MAYTTINKSTAHFNTKLYTGNNSYGHSITGVGFQPDFVWIKSRNTAKDSNIYDAVRGTDKTLESNTTDAERTAVNLLGSFDSDGFTVDDDSQINGNYTYASWNWKANGAGSTNTDGNNPNTVTVSANTTAGFSIIKYQGTDTGGQTIGHGLGVKPKLFMCKNLSETDNWMVWWDNDNNGTGEVRMILNSTNNDYGNYPVTFGTSTITLPTQSDNAWNGNGDNFIGYAFAEKTGYSKVGSYVANSNSDGNFVYLGFKPSFLMVKAYTGGSSGSRDWQLVDNKRLGYNVDNNCLFPNLNNAEDTGDVVDLLSNGFKIRSATGTWNTSGESYIYIAFGQTMVGTNNVPCTAR